jgi:hypothetical protein
MKQCLLLMVLLPMPAAAQPLADLSEWRVAWPLLNAEAPAGYVRLELSPAILDTSAPGLEDLRLAYAREGEDALRPPRHQLVPYILHRPPVGARQVASWKPIQVLDRSYVPELYEQLVLDYGEPVQKNRLRIELSGQNYRRRVTVEGSNDGRDWRVLKEDAWLFNIRQPSGTYDVDTVDLPLNRFRFLRLTAHHMADDPRRIDIQHVDTLHYEISALPLAEVAIASWDVEFDEKLKATDIVFDVGYRNLPLAELELDVATPLFYRAYELAGRNAATARMVRRTETGWDRAEREQAWTTVQRGVIYRIERLGRVEEQVVLETIQARYRYLRLRVIDEDNQPLDVRGAQIRRGPLPVLVFENDPAAPITLFCGNPSARAPAFDLSRALRDLDVAALPAVAAGPVPTVAVDRAPWTARQGWVIWVALVAAVAVMGWLIIGSLGKLRQAPTGDEDE